MSNLPAICASLYRAKDQQKFIERCINDPDNRSLSPAVLRQVDKKCGPLMPLIKARECASELGMNAPEPSSKSEIEKPHVTLIDARSSLNQCEDKCDEPYLNEKITEEAWEKCLEECYVGKENLEALGRINKIERAKKRRKDHERMTPWGKFGLSVGIELARMRAKYKGAFETWNKEKPDKALKSDDGFINRNWRVGLNLALGTGPGLTRIPGTNVLFRGNFIDFTVFDDEEFKIDDGESDRSHLKLGDMRVTLFDIDFHIPLFERAFFEVGGALVKEDMLWGKHSTPILLIPLNIHIGINWMFQGTPLTISERDLDVKGMYYTLRSYTMLGLSAEIASLSIYKSKKKAEFCNQANPGCDDYKVSEHFPFEAYSNETILAPFEGDTTQLRLTAHLFGAQEWDDIATTYRAYIDFYPIWDKIELGAEASFHIFLSTKALEFYIKAAGRGFFSLEDDNNIPLPDSGYEFRTTSGLTLHFSELF